MRWARRQLWTARRFGITPTGLLSRARPGDVPGVLCVTVPKSGTHLLERALCLHPRLHRSFLPTLHEGNVFELGGPRSLFRQIRPGQVVVGHLPHQPEFEAAAREHRLAVVLLVRDPRDVAVSEMHHALADPDIPGHALLRAEADDDARLRLIVEGRGSALAPLAQRIGRFTGWLDSGAHLVRFEELVGPEGGGDATRQLEALRALYAHVGAPTPDTRLLRLRDRLFSDASPTFRRGQSGAWRQAFPPDLADQLADGSGALLSTLGYER